jgi:transposase InsO family protein
VPWKECSVVDERMKFVIRRDAGESMSELCREFGISRKTGHKIYKRYKQTGLDGVRDEPRRPRSSPNRTSADVEALIVGAKQQRPTWGSKKLEKALERRHPGIDLPSRCTIEEILKRNGLVGARRRRKLIPEYPEHLTVSQAPNDVWCADFKGQFRLGNGKLCYPLTITDHFTRYLIACVALERPTAAATFAVFDEVFSRYGLPRAIRTDNGVPFASRGLGGLSRLSAWWSSLGIKPERIEPGHPEQNGRHERMHRTLKQEATRPAAATFLAQQEKFDAFVADFNHDRPHEALEMRRPAELYSPSAGSYPRQLDSITYPLHDVTSRVASIGSIKSAKVSPHWIFLGRAFVGHNVGLRELPDGRWLVTFAKMDLGYVDPDGGRLEALDTLTTVRDERAHLKNRPPGGGSTADKEAAPPIL